MTTNQNSDLWTYFLNNHWRVKSYDGCCQCDACEEMRKEYKKWYEELIKG